MRVVGRLLLILFLLLVIAAILVGGLFVLDRLEVLTMQDYLAPVLRRVGLAPKLPAPEDTASLLNQARFEKRLEALAARDESLQRRAEELERAQQKVEEREAELREWQQQLAEGHQDLLEQQQRYQDRDRKLKQLVAQLNNMPPDRAVAQLDQMDPYLVVDLLRKADEVAAEARSESLVSYWMSLMSAERSAKVGGLMVKKP